jgi:hypothetical protein
MAVATFKPAATAVPTLMITQTTPQTVVTVDGTSSKPQALHEKLRAVSRGFDFCGAPPRGWDETVREDDHVECARIYKAMVEVHKEIGDAGYDADIGLENQNAYYRLRMFGLQRPITVEDFVALKAFGSRVLTVHYDPSAQSADPQFRGALVVLVSTSLNERERELAKSSLPPVPQPELHPPAEVVGVEVPNGKKRKTFTIEIPAIWPFSGR